jgi:uncharacterized protein YndB with AHSA1/START domain
MLEIHQLIGVKATPAKAFAAIATPKGVAGWWTRTVRGEIARGETFDLLFDKSKVRLKTTELKAGRKLVWQAVADDYKVFTGTQVTFELSRGKGETIIRMAHTGFKGKPSFEFAFLSMKWATFMLSLKDYIEKGKGRPFPRDVYVMHQDF